MSTNPNSLGTIHREMMRRCYDERSVAYSSYGAKGIKVCPEWHDREQFREWAHNNGHINGFRLNRYDSTKDYEPSNCYWGNRSTKKSNVGVTYRRRNKPTVKELNKAKYGVENLTDHPLYHIYVGIIRRCTNPKDNAYRFYGGRGITVCDEWLGEDGFYNFMKWSDSLGTYHKGMTIVRIDPNENYCPHNCQWATWREQGLHRRNVRVVTVGDKDYSAYDFCVRFNVPYGKFLYRLNKGMKISEILEELGK